MVDEEEEAERKREKKVKKGRGRRIDSVEREVAMKRVAVEGLKIRGRKRGAVFRIVSRLGRVGTEPEEKRARGRDGELDVSFQRSLVWSIPFRSSASSVDPARISWIRGGPSSREGGAEAKKAELDRTGKGGMGVESRKGNRKKVDQAPFELWLNEQLFRVPR